MALTPLITRDNYYGKEVVERGTPDFPVGFYTLDLMKVHPAWHYHNELEFNWIETGSLDVQIGHMHKHLSAGDGWFVNTGVLHTSWADNNARVIQNALVFDPSIVGGEKGSVFWTKYLNPVITNKKLPGIVLTRDIEWHAEILDDIKQAFAFGIAEPEGFEIEIRNRLSHAMYLIGHHDHAKVSLLTPKQMRDNQRIKLMIKYVNDHLSEALELQDIAAAADISETECLRCFHDTIKMPPIQYVKKRRIKKAVELLVTTDNKVVDIAFACGFQDMSYFSKVFRSALGCTPTEYRKERAYLASKRITRQR